LPAGFFQSATRCQARPEEFIEGRPAARSSNTTAAPTTCASAITRAELRRYRGGALSDEITGAVIVYNNLTDVFTVDGQKKATPSADGQTGGGRVRAVLAPKEPAAGAAAPAAPASGPALRPSNSLGGGSQ
jgi:lipopolysaccharide export system protein LptA